MEVSERCNDSALTLTISDVNGKLTQIDVQAGEHAVTVEIGGPGQSPDASYVTSANTVGNFVLPANEQVQTFLHQDTTHANQAKDWRSFEHRVFW